MCKTAAHFWVKFCNFIELVLGLTFGGYGAYLAAKEPMNFSYLVIGIGGFMVLVSLVGFCSVGNRTTNGLGIYSLLLTLAFLGHLLFAIFCLFKKQKVLDWIATHSHDSARVQKIEDFAEKHITALGYVTVGILILEFVALFISCCFRDELRSQYLDLDEDVSYSRRTSERPLIQHPRTDAHREEMNRKYGGLFSKSGPQSGSSTNFV